MKKTCFVLFSTLLFSVVNAQITLNLSDFNQQDTSYIVSTADNTLDISLTGANYNWDFSDLIANSQNELRFNTMSGAPLFVNILFGTFAPTNYKATYYQNSFSLPFDASSSIIPFPILIEDVNEFTRVTADSITKVGFSLVANGQELPFRSDTIEKLYEFPLEFGSSYQSRAFTEIDLNPVYNAIFKQFKQTNSTVDGWGSLTTPYGTFNALRIKHVIAETDSVFLDVFGTDIGSPIPIPQTNVYEWWTNNEGIPLLKVTTTVVAGFEQVTEVVFKDNYQAGLSTTEEQLAQIIIQNPIENTVKISTTDNIQRIKLYNLQGKLVKQSTEKSFAVNTLPAGNYFIQCFVLLICPVSCTV